MSEERIRTLAYVGFMASVLGMYALYLRNSNKRSTAFNDELMAKLPNSMMEQGGQAE